MTGKAQTSCPTHHTQHPGRCSFRRDAFRTWHSRHSEARHNDGCAICRNDNFHRCSNRACSWAHFCITWGGKHPTRETTVAAPSPSEQCRPSGRMPPPPPPPSSRRNRSRSGAYNTHQSWSPADNRHQAILGSCPGKVAKMSPTTPTVQTCKEGNEFYWRKTFYL